jgi:GNAT superfamily N-acetyltransferase
LNNPNIVHSYSFDDQSITPQHADSGSMIASLSGYRKVQPLPGVPIWKKMDTPEQLLGLLNKFGLKQVQQWLVMKDTGTVHCRGKSVQYGYACPADLPAGFFDEICRMVEAGGSVNMQKVHYNLERAFLIGYAMEFGCIVGNSSLKEPRPEYIQTLNQNTGIDFSGFLERGYTSVRPAYRGMGIGTRLLEGLTRRTRGRRLYSIIAEDNLATQTIATRNKTRKLATFFSQKTGKQVGVWVPE